MLSRIAMILILLVAGPYYWLLMEPGPISAPAMPIDIARLRSEAARQTGPRPTAIEYVAVASQNTAGTLLVAGGGLRSDETAVLAWRLITPGGDTVINAGLTDYQAMSSGFAAFSPPFQATLNTWVSAARRVIFTDEDIEHIGGLATVLPKANAVSAKIIGNAAQIAAIRELVPATADALAPAAAALSGPPGYAGVAPGIAVLRTPGHLPGSQMIYVQLENGREFLFVGNTAPMKRNVTWGRPRSRYAAEWLGSEDRTATTGWIKGLAQLQTREPRLAFVYARDLAWLRDDAGPHLTVAPAGPVTAADKAAAR